MLLLSSIDQTAPIAVYDSGVGGMAIAQALQKMLPQECIHYIGDTQHAPYGNKTTAQLCNYIQQTIHFCLDKQYKLLVIACNTAAAAAAHLSPSYLATIKQKIGIITVVEPVIAHLISTKKYHHIGLIGTQYTIKYEIYSKQLQAAGILISSKSTPLLASMIENTFCHGKINKDLIHNYLTQLPCSTIDALLLACTHYLFLTQACNVFFKTHHHKTLTIIDVAQLTALAVKQFLSDYKLANTSGQTLPNCFMATALTIGFTNASQKLFRQTPIKIDLAPYATSTDPIFAYV